MMSILNSIKKEFDKRHDFKDDDINHLISKFPGVIFYKIPLAWVALIDEMISDMEDSCIKEVRQEFGQLVVLFNKQDDEELSINRSIVDEFDAKIKLIDQDLHALL